LEIHNGTRSAKWVELSENPQATALGYCSTTRTQHRLIGNVELFPSETPQALAAWDALPPWTRTTYAGGPPGDERAFSNKETEPSSPVAEAGCGKRVFGVVVFRAEMLDWFRLERQNNTRTQFRYDQTGAQVGELWSNP
jgi:hypothetical protein